MGRIGKLIVVLVLIVIAGYTATLFYSAYQHHKTINAIKVSKEKALFDEYGN